MKGIGVSSGIAIGRAFVIKESEYMLTGISLTSDAGTFTEIAKFEQAVETSIEEVASIIRIKS